MLVTFYNCRMTSEHFSSERPIRRGAVAVIVRGDRLLVIKRSETVTAPGMFCFPGGGIEPGELEEQALVREIHEELGVVIQPVRKLWHSMTPWKFDLAWWLGAIEADATLAANPAEVAAVHWHTPAEMLELEHLLESNRAFLRALASGEFVLG